MSAPFPGAGSLFDQGALDARKARAVYPDRDETTGAALARPVAGYAVTDAVEALDVEMDQTTWLGIFITHDRPAGICKCLQSV